MSYVGDDPLNKPTCNKADPNAITCAAAQQDCVYIHTYCDALPQLSLALPDIDTDGNGFPDAMSVGFWFTGVGASALVATP